MSEKEFLNELMKMNINIDEEQLKKLKELYELMIDYNKKVNLTRIVNKEDVYLKHYYDSLTLFKVVNLNMIDTMCDVGSGAGFPGLVIKIVFPNIKITLVDSQKKRVDYLNYVIKKLNLKNITAIHNRAENVEEKYTLVVSRAVARIDKLLHFCYPLINEKGIFVAMKGKFEEEKLLIDNDQYKYKLKKFKLPKEDSERTLVLFYQKNTDKKCCLI